jgi:SagB-type dehydrogenase family enzyme
VSAPPPQQTARWLEFIYGDRPDPDDPAEAYHEASKLSPSRLAWQMKGVRRLEASTELQLSSTRAVRRSGGATMPSPTPAPLASALGEVIARRRSRRDFGCGPIDLDALAALLDAGYGVTGAIESTDHPPVPVRAVPSGGALYPLELYAAVLRVQGLEPGLYHFDPLAPGLESVRPCLTADEVAALCTYPEIGSSCAVLLLVAGIFGRTRFKYGLRGYRFALLEAGHVAQNIVLAATALDLAAVPLGAFYDQRADAFLGLDGVNESTLYTIAVGRDQA